MSNLTTVNQRSLASRERRESFGVYMSRDAVKNQINTIVGGKNGQRFMTAIISAVSVNPALQECTHQTILSSALLGESLNLSPSPQLGQYYILPFKKKGKNGEPDEMVATFVLGYKGYIQLAIRSGYYKKLNALPIKEGELVRFDALNEEIEVNMIEDDELREKTPTVGYYVMFEYQNGFKKAMYWSKKKMIAHADKYSPAFNVKSFTELEAGKVAEKDMWKYSSFWYKDFDGMALKTMLRQLISKWGIMSIELREAFEKDNSFIDENGNSNFVENDMTQDNQITEANYQVSEESNTSLEEDNDDPFSD